MGTVPYKGAGPAAQAVVAGDVSVTIAAVPAVQGFIKDGRLRALAVGADTRFAVLPDVPTMREAGASHDILVPTTSAFSPQRARRPRSSPSSTRR